MRLIPSGEAPGLVLAGAGLLVALVALPDRRRRVAVCGLAVGVDDGLFRDDESVRRRGHGELQAGEHPRPFR